MSKHIITVEIELSDGGNKPHALQSIIEDVTAYLVDGYGPDNSTAADAPSRTDYAGPYIVAIGESSITD